MLRKSKIYLDTSVISFLYADDAPDKRDITIDFFRDFIRTAIYETYISDFVVAEIENTTDLKHKQRMLSVIADYNISFLVTVQQYYKEIGLHNKAHSIA
jgi:hypothetical protein